MIKIDGSFGEGGGQIIRSSLALSMITGAPFEIKNVRAGRAKPGLQPQHLMSVNAAAQVSGADVSGAAVGSQSFIFKPGKISAGNYHFRIGTAGSTMLVLQTVLPALMVQSEPSEIVIEGGTHNTHAPPYEFIKNTFLPLIKRMGPDVELELQRYGFYPPGGGQITSRIYPSAIQPLTLLERGAALSKQARVLLIKLPRVIAERELKVVSEEMTGWKPKELVVEESDNALSPGNVLLIEYAFENLVETVTSIGERKLSSEKVAENAVTEARSYISHSAPVGEHLADQLLIPMALAGTGAFRTGPLSVHTITNMEVIKYFLEVKFKISKREDFVEIEVERDG
jgi:RNA 3'-terminal phosphate cyclase (ATP)